MVAYEVPYNIDTSKKKKSNNLHNKFERLRNHYLWATHEGFLFQEWAEN